MGSGGGSASNVTRNETNIVNEIDTAPLADALADSNKMLNSTISQVASYSLALTKQGQESIKSLNATLSELAKNSSIDNQQQTQILQGLALVTGAGLTYFAVKKKRGKNGK